MSSDLQRIVDGLAERLGLPTQLTDPRMESLVFGPHHDKIDWIRRETVLLRRTPPEVRAYLEQFGVTTATEPLRIPSDPDRNVMSRVVVPARSHGLTYGILWFLDDEQRMTDDQLADAVDVATEIGRLLYRDQRLRHADTELVRDLLADSPDLRHRATGQILDRGLFPSRAAVAVAVLLHEAAGAGPDPAIEIEARLLSTGRDALPAGALRWIEPNQTVLVVPVPTGGADAAARAIAERAHRLCRDAGADRISVGVADPQPDLGHAHEAHRQACLAARVAHQVPAVGPVAAWSQLGVYRALASIPPEQLGTAALDPRVRRILDTGDPSLVATLEAYLDNGCDMKQTCAQLHVHRGTVYYRLQKSEALSGLVLQDGMDRLALHLGLKIARLAGLMRD